MLLGCSKIGDAMEQISRRHGAIMESSSKLTIKQVSSELGVDERTVRRWIKSGQLPYVGYDIRGRYLVARSDLDAFVKKRTQPDRSDSG
jgi:excisionase family DNA binding protein